MLRKASVIFATITALAVLSPAQSVRHFTFHYGFTVKNVPAGEHMLVLRVVDSGNNAGLKKLVLR